jgi:spore coat protein H
LEGGAVAEEGCSLEPAVAWLEEGQPVEAVVDCGDFALGDGAPLGIEIVDDRVHWVPGLDQAGNYEIAVVGDGGSTTWFVGVADAFDHMDNRPVVDPARLTHEFGIDVLHLFPEEHLGDRRVDTALVHGGQSYDAEVGVRGATSLQYPKVGLDVRIDEGFRHSDPGFDGIEKLVLVPSFDDNSLIRNRLAQQLWTEMSQDHLDVSEASMVVYLDGRYMGIFTLVEDIDSSYLARNSLNTDGQLFKADDDRADFRLDDDPDASAGFDKKNGEPESGLRSMDPIGLFVEFVALADDDMFAAEIEEWVDLDDVVDWLVFTDFMAASDSVTKNAYWYQADPETPFRYLPWDFNHSYGQDWNTWRIAADTDALTMHLAFNGLFDRIYADPDLRTRVLRRYQEALAEEFSPAALLAMTDDLVMELGENLGREQRRWGAEYATYRAWSGRTDIETTFGEIAYLRDWIPARHEFVNAAVEAGVADSG